MDGHWMENGWTLDGKWMEVDGKWMEIGWKMDGD